MNKALAQIYADCQRSLDTTGVAPLRALAQTHVVITGGTGFVGTWLLCLIAYLNDRHDFGTRVTAIARQPQHLARTAPYLAERDDITLVASDVRQLAKLPADTAWLAHAAAIPDRRHHATDPIGTASVIAEGTLRVLHATEPLQSLRGMLYFSSGLVHGAPGVDGDRRIDASSVYVDAKRFGESLCAAFRSQARLPVVVTRPFTFMGPFQALDAPWAANNFLHSALNGLPLKLLGSGSAPRAFMYGSDMAVLALCQLVGGRSGEVFDLGGADAIPVLALARMVADQAARPLEIRTNTEARGHIANPLVPDLRPSAERFGFQPAFDPAAAVQRTLAWHRDQAPPAPAAR